MDKDEEFLEYYIKIGAISLEGIDSNGEAIFAITEEAKELAPELWEAHKQYVDNAMIDMYKKDLIEVEYDENLNATIKISKEGIDLAKRYGLIDPRD